MGDIYLQSTATATGDGNHTATVTDVNGNTTTYHYNSQYEYLTSVVNAKNQTTYYIYDTDNSRPTMTYQSGIASVSYSYSSDGRLSELDRKTFRNGAELHQYYNFAYNLWGQQTGISVGSQALATYTYEDIGAVNKGGGNLKKLTYGNGQYVEYTYDEFDRLVKMVYNSGRYVTYTYNAEGSLAKLTYGDGTTEKGSCTFEYDSLGRLIRSRETGSNGTFIQRTEHVYDNYDRLATQSWVIGGTSFTENYTYSDGASGDGSLTQMTTATGDTLNYTYDALKRLQKVTVKNGSTALFSTAYAYRSVNGNQSSAQVQYRNVRIGTSGTILEGKKYVYDALGNITEIRQSTSPYNLLVAYEYDSRNQLISEVYYDGNGSANTNITLAYYYTYDTAGNLLKVEEGAVNSDGTITKTTVQTYTYGTDDWKDLLTAVNGNPIIYEGQTYNASAGEIEGAATGNPTSYQTHGTFYDMSWANGRQLVYISCYEGHWQAAYTYDAEGIRTSKNDDGVLHTYVTQNGKVVRETIGTGSSAKVLDFIYDESGKPFALRYSTNNGSSFTTYYYVLNLQGDVVKLVTASGTAVATYTYDAWGNILSASGSMAAINPLRYRGYYYDTETGFYYLQSRYYDPANHRFINADSYASTGQGFVGTNMFAYCNNNPVNRTDEVGTVSSSTEDNNNNGIPDYLEIRWREQTLKAKSNLASDQETGFTVIAGGTLRAAMEVSVSVSVYCAFDMHGNLALYVSPGIGGGFPSASLGAFFGAISAPDANNIDGMGFTIGGSLCEGVKGGGDYIMAVDKKNQRTYHGGTIALGGGASVPVPAELHAEATYGFNIFSINILELLR